MKRPPPPERYLDTTGRLKLIPKRPVAKAAALAWLVARFEPGRDYNEREVNEIIQSSHTFMDHARLRRELIDAGLLARTTNGARYWRPAEPLSH